MDKLDQSMFRMMAWQRAKGELNSIMEMWNSEKGPNYNIEETNFFQFKKLVDEFVKKVEDDDLLGA